jgi:hypothetical protein
MLAFTLLATLALMQVPAPPVVTITLVRWPFT